MSLIDVLETCRSPLHFRHICTEVEIFFFGHVSVCGLFYNMRHRHIMVKILLLQNTVQIANCCSSAKMSRKTQGHNLAYLTLLNSFAIFSLQLQMISDTLLHSGYLGVLLVAMVDVLMSFYFSLYKNSMTLLEQLLTSVLPLPEKIPEALSVQWDGDMTSGIYSFN